MAVKGRLVLTRTKVNQWIFVTVTLMQPKVEVLSYVLVYPVLLLFFFNTSSFLSDLLERVWSGDVEHTDAHNLELVVGCMFLVCVGYRTYQWLFSLSQLDCTVLYGVIY